MAKRKKSKKPAKSKAFAEVQAPETNEPAGAEIEATEADDTSLAAEDLAALIAESVEGSSDTAAVAEQSADETADAAQTNAAPAEDAQNAQSSEDAMEAPAVALESKRKRGKKHTSRSQAKAPAADGPAPSEAPESIPTEPALSADDAENTGETTELAAESSNATSGTAEAEDSTVWPAADDTDAASTSESTFPDAEAYDSTWASDAGSEAPQTDTASAEASAFDGASADAADVADRAEGTEASATDGEAATDGEQSPDKLSDERLESIVESLLFASDKSLSLFELKRLIGEKDGKKVGAAVERLIERRKGTGIEVIATSTGWHLRTSAENADWVGKLLIGKPVRLSRAMLETLAIVAYRQPVTRPEVDDIRGVDCGAVLKTLLDRGLIRIIGKKEEVGRPMLYGTTPEFLRVFNLRDLSELPTLREFYDLSAEDQSKVEAEHGPTETPSATTAKPDVAMTSVARGALTPEPEDTDPLLDELDEASQLAKKALGDLDPPAAESEAAPAASENDNKGEKEISPLGTE